MFMDNILHSVMRKMVIPDVEFIVNLGDWPLVDPQVSRYLDSQCSIKENVLLCAVDGILAETPIYFTSV